MQQHLANILNTPRWDENDHGEQDAVTPENDPGRTGAMASEEGQLGHQPAEDSSGGEDGTGSQGAEEDSPHEDEEEDAATTAAAKRVQLKALQQQIEALEVDKQLQQAQRRLRALQQGAVDGCHPPDAQEIGALTRLKLPEVKAEKVGEVRSWISKVENALAFYDGLGLHPDKTAIN